MAFGQRGDLAHRFDRRDVRPARREDRIELARHDVAGKARLQRHQADVARCVGPAQLIARLEGQEADVRRGRACRDRRFEAACGCRRR